MPARPRGKTDPLTVDAIVEAACALIAEHGLASLSMRRLGAALGVDPMAIYHHVPNKRELLSLVMGRTVGAMALPAPDDPWDVRVRDWATAYWQIVVANREIVAAGLADPVIAAGGLPLTEPLNNAVADSGIDPDLVQPNAWLVVDFVHGAALGAAAPLRQADDDIAELLRAFDAGLDTIVAGIAARAPGHPS
jgi:AcrR family transcriptional regulator